MLQVMWVLLAFVILVCALLVGRRPGALRVGLRAVSFLFLVAGAGANLFLLLTGETYALFADTSSFAFVKDTWRSLVVPNHGLFIGLLILFEATVGVLVLLGHRARQVGLVAAIVFHVLLVAFGWGFALWSVPMIVGLALLLRAENRRASAEARIAPSGREPAVG